MKNVIRILVLALVAGVFSLAFATAPANAAGSCKYIGWSAQYGFSGEPLEVDFSGQNAFQEYKCRFNGVLVFKSVGNKRSEKAALRAVAKKAANRHMPIAFCVNGKRSQLLDFGDYWLNMSPITKREKRNYLAWVTKYAKRGGCKLYR